MTKTPMTGAYAPNPHEGSRSEILADYLFSSWGTVTPVRRQDDYGIDLYCTLSDRIGQRAVVRDYFVVQVKSGTDRWIFEHEESVRWLVEYPNPLFLACVDKKNLSVSVYLVMPRFHVWALGKLPVRLELKPEGRDDGKSVPWENGESFSLSAPIIRATIADLSDRDKMPFGYRPVTFRGPMSDSHLWPHLNRFFSLVLDKATLHRRPFCSS
jgi:hypothetical protein